MLLVMKVKTIMAKQQKENVKFELAVRIREMLDAAKKEYGAQDWEDDDVENEVSELVFGED
jgi:hypothetical protein